MLKCLQCLSAVLLLAAASRAARVPLRADLPAGAGPQAVPLGGGVPLPRGDLKSPDHVCLLAADGSELDCQVAATAWWPDGSIKWVMIDAVLAPAKAAALTLEYGPGVRRKAPADGLKAALAGGAAEVSGGGVKAAIRRDGGGVLDACVLAGRTLVAPDAPARLVVDTLRIADADTGRALPTHRYVCPDPQAKLDVGRVRIDELAVESPGPIRATVRIRGAVLLKQFGSTLPDVVRRREPPGQLPFTLRLSFYRGCPVVFGQHQIVFAGEPDRDFIARWGIELPGQAGTRGRLILEPGVELDVTASAAAVAAEQARLCWAPIRGGLALIREGWENRPCAIGQRGGSAWIDFWPAEAGVWDLRRYAREWAVGENGDTKDAAGMVRYAPYAARGLAKSHDFVLYAGEAAPPIARALAARALLVAPPAWYAASEALGPFAPAQSAGPHAAIDRRTGRRIDYHLYCQDLFRWHGKLEYGFWQTRFGQIHRTDRWERDYGRWGWSLNDGAGRIGQVLMLEFLRTGRRDYFQAGAAFNRINYDTAMVHTLQHMERPGSWWTARGCTHRHNVQPFGCPYVGMRGSCPGGQRILHLLTGDGVIADGLEMVAEACFQYASGARGRLCHSGGPDGQGSAANAMLWKHETTGDEKYLQACRVILDASGLVPPAGGKNLGYGPDFGLFNAAGEYADLTGDAGFRDRVAAIARLGAGDKEPARFLYPLAMGYRFTKDASLRKKLVEALGRFAETPQPGLAELPAAQWPGHGGYMTPQFQPNIVRDVPYALGVLARPVAPGAWPAAAKPLKPIPADRPAGWFLPGGAQKPGETVPPAAELSAAKAGSGGGNLTAGGARWAAKAALCDEVQIGGPSPLAGAVEAYVTLTKVRDGDGRLTSELEVLRGRVERVGTADGAIVATGKAGPASFTARLRAASADGVPSVRVEIACRIPPGGGRVASWGLRVPLRLGRDAHAIQTTAPGRFRLERCRLDQNDERIPNWLTSEYHWGEGAPLWPKWRLGGIGVGPGRAYRIWRANRGDCSPLFCDQGEGDAAWLDLTDRGGPTHWGLTVRVLRPAATGPRPDRQAVRADLESGLVEVQFHDAAAEPLTEADAERGLAGAADLIFHDGWRPPLAKPELTRAQYERFLDDLNYGGNYGLMALRFCLSPTHMVRGRQWAERVRDLGVEPREILYGMLWRDSLAKHCAKLGVRWDGEDIEASVRRIVEHYRGNRE